METNVYVCKKCKREISENKELCQHCQNKKGDKERIISKGILVLMLAGVAAIKSFSGLSDKSDNDEL